MPRPLHAFIHPQALQHNLSRLRLAAGDARLWAVVKANAYGHGLARAYEALRAADGFALLDLNEAQTLRDLGWRGPLLLGVAHSSQRLPSIAHLPTDIALDGVVTERGIRFFQGGET